MPGYNLGLICMFWLLSCGANAEQTFNMPQACIDLARREHVEIPRNNQEFALAQAQLSQYAAMFPNDYLLNKCRKEVQRLLSKRRE